MSRVEQQHLKRNRVPIWATTSSQAVSGRYGAPKANLAEELGFQLTKRNFFEWMM